MAIKTTIDVTVRFMSVEVSINGTNDTFDHRSERMSYGMLKHCMIRKGLIPVGSLLFDYEEGLDIQDGAHVLKSCRLYSRVYSNSKVVAAIADGSAAAAVDGSASVAPTSPSAFETALAAPSVAMVVMALPR